jgi:hypothetical protein
MVDGRKFLLSSEKQVQLLDKIVRPIRQIQMREEEPGENAETFSVQLGRDWDDRKREADLLGQTVIQVMKTLTRDLFRRIEREIRDRVEKNIQGDQALAKHLPSVEYLTELT